MTTKDVALVYDTILSIPGMNEQVKIDLKISRKTVLLLSQVIERGLGVKDEQGLPDVVAAGELNDLKILGNSCLEKAGLIELAEKLKSIQSK